MAQKAAVSPFLLLLLHIAGAAAAPKLVVIAGGPGAADHGALRAAKATGIPTKGYYTASQKGFKQWVADLYGLSMKENVEARDKANAGLADFTLNLFRPDVYETGVKVVNQALFGFYQEVDEIELDKKARGPLHEDEEIEPKPKQFVEQGVAWFKKGEEYDSLPETAPSAMIERNFTETVTANTSAISLELVESTNDTVHEDVIYSIGVEMDLAIPVDEVWAAIPTKLDSSTTGALALHLLDRHEWIHKEGTPDWPNVGSLIESVRPTDEAEAVSLEVTKLDKETKTFEYKGISKQGVDKKEEVWTIGTVRCVPHEGNPKATTLTWALNLKGMVDILAEDEGPQEEQDLQEMFKDGLDLMLAKLEPMVTTALGTQRPDPSKLPTGEVEEPRPTIGLHYPAWYMPEVGIERAGELIQDAICRDYSTSKKPEFVIFVTGSAEQDSPGVVHAAEAILSKPLQAIKDGACSGAGPVPLPPASSDTGTAVIVVVAVVLVMTIVGIGIGVYKFTSAKSSRSDALIGSNVELGGS